MGHSPYQNPNYYPSSDYYAPQSLNQTSRPPLQQQYPYPPNMQHQSLQHTTHFNYQQQQEQYPYPTQPTQHPHQQYHSMSPTTPQSAAPSGYATYSSQMQQSSGIPGSMSAYPKPSTGPVMVGAPAQGAHPQFQRTMSITSTSSHGNTSALSTPTLAPSSSTSASAGGNGGGEIVSPASGSTSTFSEPSVRTPAAEPGFTSASVPSTYPSVHFGGMGNVVYSNHGGSNGGEYTSSNPAMPISSPQAPTVHGSQGLSGNYGQNPGGQAYTQNRSPTAQPPPLQEQFTGKHIMTPEDLHEYRRMLNAAQQHGQMHSFNPSLSGTGAPTNRRPSGPGGAVGVSGLPANARSTRTGSETGVMTGAGK